LQAEILAKCGLPQKQCDEYLRKEAEMIVCIESLETSMTGLVFELGYMKLEATFPVNHSCNPSILSEGIKIYYLFLSYKYNNHMQL
jgi:hypothetical protein